MREWLRRVPPCGSSQPPRTGSHPCEAKDPQRQTAWQMGGSSRKLLSDVELPGPFQTHGAPGPGEREGCTASRGHLV